MTPSKSHEKERAGKSVIWLQNHCKQEDRMFVYSQNFLGYLCNNWLDGWLLPEKNMLWVVYTVLCMFKEEI